MAGYPSQPETFTGTSSPLLVTSPVLANDDPVEEDSKEELINLWKDVFDKFSKLNNAYTIEIQPYLDQVALNKGQPPTETKLSSLLTPLVKFRASYKELLELLNNQPILEPEPDNSEKKIPKIKTAYQDILTQDIQKEIKNIESYLKDCERVLWGLKGGFEGADDITTPEQKKEKIRQVQQLVGNKEEHWTGLYLSETNKNVQKYFIDTSESTKGKLTKLKEIIDDINTSFNKNTAFIEADDKPNWIDNAKNPWLWLLLTPIVVILVKSIQSLRKARGKTPSPPPTQGPSSEEDRKGLDLHFSRWSPSNWSGTKSPTTARELSPKEKAQIFLYVDHILKTRGIQTPVAEPPSSVISYPKEQIERIVQEYLDNNLSYIISQVAKAVSPSSGQIINQQNSLQAPTYLTATDSNFPDQRHQQDNSIQTWIKFYNNPEAQNTNLPSYRKVIREFSNKALELEETPDSYHRRRSSVANQEIKLEVVDKNKGSFWLLPQDNGGWLFPKFNNITEAVEILFLVQRKKDKYNYIQVIKPALLTTSDAQGNFWTLHDKGHIVLDLLP